MRIFAFFLLATLLTACSPRSIPPEITSLHEAKKPPPILQKHEVVIIDAGHGGKDPGAVSKRDRYEEKQLTLETAFLICEHLKRLGYKAVLTRTHDTYLPLDSRSDFANTLDADLFVSIHYNYSPSEEAKGIEVFYYKENKTPPSSRIVSSKQVGQEVLRRMILHTGADSRGIKQANFAVIRQTKMPAILVEAGFLSNPYEREKIRDQKYIYALAKGIAHGIDHYFETTRCLISPR